VFVQWLHRPVLRSCRYEETRTAYADAYTARTLAVVTEPSTIREGACAVITVSDLTDLAHIFVVAAIFATRLTALIPVAAGLVFTDIPPTAAATTECIIAIPTSVAEGS